jgi:hypothetical protein
MKNKWFAIRWLIVFMILSSSIYTNVSPVSAGNNGQQVSVRLCYANSFTISGTNQNAYSQQTTFKSEIADPKGCIIRQVADWWWVGDITVSVNYVDGTTDTRYFTIPQLGNDWVELDLSRNPIVERGAQWLNLDPDYDWYTYLNVENSILNGYNDLSSTQKAGYYRTDCSGFVSYAWGIPDISSPDTVALHYGRQNTDGSIQTFSYPIAISNLQPGDIVVNPKSGLDGHVILFVAWVDMASLTFIGYDQYNYTSSDQGTRFLKYYMTNVNGSQADLYAYYGSFPSLLAGPYFADRKY